jgi:hypothetical protein
MFARNLTTPAQVHGPVPPHRLPTDVPIGISSGARGDAGTGVGTLPSLGCPVAPAANFREARSRLAIEAL